MEFSVRFSFSFRCCCGRVEEDHLPDARNETSYANKWDPDKHTKEDGPTDAYGELEFTGAGPSSRAKVGTSAMYWSMKERVLTATCILRAAY